LWKNDGFAAEMTKPSITAFVLAGGQSTRMGSDKASLMLGNETLLERSLKLARTVCSEVKIVGSAEKFARFGNVVEDVYPECGPLAGIHAALVASTTDRNLVLAVDLPFIQARFLQFLMSRSKDLGATVTLPRVDDRWQPLCAVYQKEFAAPAEAALKKGEFRIDALFPSIKLKIIDGGELARMGMSPEMFRNLNTPADLEKARHQV
jgi:molybdenum cofactor guanylyltransferase